MPDYSTDSSTTRRLLMRIRSGDQEAFNELFERFRTDLKTAVELRLDRQLRVRLDASDIVQETQLMAFRRLDDYLQRRPMPFGLWLRKTAQERIRDQRRKHVKNTGRDVRREEPLPDKSSLMLAAPLLTRSSCPSQRVVKREHQRLVNEAVAELAEADREILLMRHVEALSQFEIAQVLELNHDAVRKRYGRALIRLQRLLVAKGLSEVES